MNEADMLGSIECFHLRAHWNHRQHFNTVENRHTNFDSAYILLGLNLRMEREKQAEMSHFQQ